VIVNIWNTKSHLIHSYKKSSISLSISNLTGEAAHDQFWIWNLGKLILICNFGWDTTALNLQKIKSHSRRSWFDDKPKVPLRHKETVDGSHYSWSPCMKYAQEHEANQTTHWPWVVLAMGQGNVPAAWVCTAKTDRFGSRPIQKPDPLTLGGPHSDPEPSARGYRWVWLDPVGSYPWFHVLGFPFIITLRYVTVNHKILRLVSHSPFSMNSPP